MSWHPASIEGLPLFHITWEEKESNGSSNFNMTKIDIKNSEDLQLRFCPCVIPIPNPLCKLWTQKKKRSVEINNFYSDFDFSLCFLDIVWIYLLDIDIRKKKKKEIKRKQEKKKKKGEKKRRKHKKYIQLGRTAKPQCLSSNQRYSQRLCIFRKLKKAENPFYENKY